MVTKIVTMDFVGSFVLNDGKFICLATQFADDSSKYTYDLKECEWDYKNDFYKNHNVDSTRGKK